MALPAVFGCTLDEIKRRLQQVAAQDGKNPAYRVQVVKEVTVSSN